MKIPYNKICLYNSVKITKLTKKLFPKGHVMKFKKQPKNSTFCFPTAVINAHIWANIYPYPPLSKLVHKGRSLKTGTADEKAVLNESKLKWSRKVDINLIAGNNGIAVFKNENFFHASFIYTKDQKSFITNPQFTDNTVEPFSEINFNIDVDSYGYLLYNQRRNDNAVRNDHESDNIRKN